MTKEKRIALVAHDNRKKDLTEWVEWNAEKLHEHHLICTGTTGKMIAEVLKSRPAKDQPKDITMLRSGPLGGDQQLGALITEGKVDMLVFFWDPMSSQPHDVDVKALLRITVVYNIPVACNRSSADFMFSSPLVDEAYEPSIRDYSDYLNRDHESA
ncbi:MAG: methylglyoxal synthase [Candidatus Eisenbacteria bacterium]|uniref:Methylglyoxal synthase n=1 Tax=Eiseniibacteriota bacterium TaxID=2212470 RepID=A0A7Y2H3U4_UNCEI|nr:methylglyoxal synthase [Candidatus Eisenbacteria bacterium]